MVIGVHGIYTIPLCVMEVKELASVTRNLYGGMYIGRPLASKLSLYTPMKGVYLDRLHNAPVRGSTGMTTYVLILLLNPSENLTFGRACGRLCGNTSLNVEIQNSVQ